MGRASALPTEWNAMEDKIFISTNDPEDIAKSFIQNIRSSEINYRSIDQLFTITDSNGNSLDVTGFSVTQDENGNINQVYIETENQ